MATTTYRVSGMTCDHCVRAVKEEISGLPGVSDVAVNLVKDGISTVTVTSAESLALSDVTTAIDEAGYELA